MEFLNTTGKRVRALREQQGWTQIALAEQLVALGAPVGSTQISKIESGAAAPSFAVLGALARALNTSTDFLMLLSDNPDAPQRDTVLASGGPRQ